MFGLRIRPAQTLEVRAGQIVQEHIKLHGEQVPPSPAQVLEELGLVDADAIETTIKPVLGRRLKIHAQQVAHRAAVKPLPMQPELAAGVDQAIDHQQLQDLGPGDRAAAAVQTTRPESPQVQVIPQPTAQPTVPKGARPPQLDPAETNANGVEGLRRDDAVFGKEAQLTMFVGRLVKDLQCVAPRGLLRIVDLAEI